MTCKQAEMKGGWVMLSDQRRRRSRNQGHHAPLSGAMYQAMQGDKQDVSALKFKHTALLAVPVPTFPCMPSLLDNRRDGTVLWIPAVWHCATTPSNLACCRCQALSQCHPAAELCVLGQAVQRTNTLHTSLDLYPDTISPKIRVI